MEMGPRFCIRRASCASCIGVSRPAPVPAVAAGSVERFLADSISDVGFVDLRRLTRQHPLRERRVAILVGYVPSIAAWSEQVDGLYFIRRTAPVT